MSDEPKLLELLRGAFDGWDELEPKRRELIYETAIRQEAVLLDQLEGHDTSEEQRAINAQVAQILSAGVARGYSGWQAFMVALGEHLASLAKGAVQAALAALLA